MQLVSTFGFSQYEGEKIHRQNSVDIIQSLHKILAQNELSDITADGVVVKTDSYRLREKLGVGTKFSKFQHCFKPQNMVATTTLLGIEYGLGRTGKVTPVALLKPVDLGGAMIGRASVCNETYMETLDLTIGCEVELVRSGDVIPYIVKVTKKGTKKFVFPTHCPSCKSLLAFDPTSEIVQRMCVNSNCAGKAAEQFAYVGKRETLEIDNLGDSMAAELVAQKITTLAGLFTFGNDIAKMPKLLESMFSFRSNVNTLKMVKSLETAKTATWDRWIAALGISFIGHSLGKEISKALKLTSDDMKNLPTLLLKLPALNLDKLGAVKTASIVDWAKDKNNIQFCARLYNAGVRPASLVTKVVGGKMKLSRTKFVMTGELKMGTRKVVAAQLEALGAEELSAVSSACNLLIVGENPGSKLAKAQAKGIKIVDENWVKEQLG
jgi:DNA ligase (NAD+)